MWLPIVQRQRAAMREHDGVCDGKAEAGRTFYLWRCRACGYRFEAVAYFECEAERESLAA